jgi:hypothetical protein
MGLQDVPARAYTGEAASLRVRLCSDLGFRSLLARIYSHRLPAPDGHHRGGGRPGRGGALICGGERCK